MTWYVVLLVVVTVGSITGCGTRNGTRGDDTLRTELASRADTVSTNPIASVDSLRDDYVEHGLLVPGSHREMIVRSGQPDSMASRPVINRHISSQTDSIIDLFYPGLHLTYYVVGEGKKEFLQTATVSDNRYLKYPQVGVGAPEAVVVRSLGEPGAREAGKYRYDCARCIGAESPLYFYFRDGRVDRVEYSFYVD